MKKTKKLQYIRAVMGSATLAVSLLAVMGFAGLSKRPGDDEKGSDDEFTIAILPDTQYYTSEKINGKRDMFFAQTDWIVKNAARQHIAYVVQLGDVSDDGEKSSQ